MLGVHNPQAAPTSLVAVVPPQSTHRHASAAVQTIFGNAARCHVASVTKEGQRVGMWERTDSAC